MENYEQKEKLSNFPTASVIIAGLNVSFLNMTSAGVDEIIR